MAKPKSMKLRTLVTLHALFKYSDENHRYNAKKLNERLRPYGLECGRRVLGDTVNVLREFGVDVQCKGEWDNQGVWIKNRPLPNDELHRLVFAVTTNPHLSKAQATDILQCLKPLVTVYQEPLLCGFVETRPAMEPDDALYWVYSVIQEAIALRRRVRYTVDYVKYNKKEQTVAKIHQWSTLFTPKCIYQSEKNLYMVGYNHVDKRVAAVNLKDITDIKLAFKHQDAGAEETLRKLADVAPQELIAGEKQELVYAGPVTFRCRGQYVGELFNRFGEASAPILKDERCRTTYPVSNAEITSETLFWLSQVPRRGIRIAGPQEANVAVSNYCKNIGKSLLDASLPRPKRKTTNK